MENLGGAVLRMQADQASYADIRTVIKALVHSKEFRSRRASMLANLATDIPLPKREEYCRAMAIMLLADFDPPSDLTHQDGVGGSWPMYKTTPSFVTHCSPPPRGQWEMAGHIVANYGTKGKPDWINVSAPLRDLLYALEEMWDTRGHLLKG